VQGTIEHLVPVFLTLLKDTYPDVRLNVISKLSQVNQVCVRARMAQAQGGSRAGGAPLLPTCCLCFFALCCAMTKLGWV